MVRLAEPGQRDGGGDGDEEPAPGGRRQPVPGLVAEEDDADDGRRDRLAQHHRRGGHCHAARLQGGRVQQERDDACSGAKPVSTRAATASTPKPSPAVRPSAVVRNGSLSLAAAMPTTARPATATMSASLNTAPTCAAPSAPAEAPSRATPATTPNTASHSRQASVTPMTLEAATAVTARFEATKACTANSGSRCRATSWATKPAASRQMLATNRHWPSSRTTRPGSTEPAASPGGRRLAARTAIAWITEAMP